MSDDPCFSCKLPDCDDTDDRCVLRRLQRSYRMKSRLGRRDQVTPEELRANSAMYDTWQLERMAQASEGIRPFRKPGSPWRGNEVRP